MEGATYLLDANVFIEAARRYYAFDVVPSFWNVLIKLAKEGKVESIDRVKEELLRGKDNLADWIRKHFSEAFASTDNEQVIDCYREIISWAKKQDKYQESAKKLFAEGADGWLVAYAYCKDRTLVTHEVLNETIRSKLPIPNACKAFNVRFVDTFGMLRKLRVKI